jgi:hypothetical protein
MPDRTLVRSIWSQDRAHRLDIFRRADGRYEFEGTRLLSEDGETFWAPSDASGIHESADAAEREALASVPWLKGHNSH